MRAVKHWVKDPVCYLYPISDVHLGSKDFDEESEDKLCGYLRWIEKTPEARAVLVGDILNTATLTTKGSPHEQRLDLQEQLDLAFKLFKPIKGKIIGASDGWHETVLQRYVGYSPTVTLCNLLGIEYFGYSGVTVLGVGQHRQGNRKPFPDCSYVIYQHHTTGGGATPGGKINRVDRLRLIVANADVYLGAHNHALGAMPVETYIVDERTGLIAPKRQLLVDCGGYVAWDGSYAEAMQLPPLKRGSARIRFNGSGDRKDVHVDL